MALQTWVCGEVRKRLRSNQRTSSLGVRRSTILRLSTSDIISNNNSGPHAGPRRQALIYEGKNDWLPLARLSGQRSRFPLTATGQTAPNDAAVDLYNSGLEHFHAERWPQAIDTTFKQAIAKDANDADAHFQLGRAYQQTGQYADALKHFKQAVELKPGDGEAMHFQGMTHFVLKQYAEAVKAYQQAAQSIRATPASTRTWESPTHI